MLIEICLKKIVTVYLFKQSNPTIISFKDILEIKTKKCWLTSDPS